MKGKKYLKLPTRLSSFWRNGVSGFIDERFALRPKFSAERFQKCCRLLGQVLHQHRAIFFKVLFCRIKIDSAK